MKFFRENPKIREALASANLERRVTISLPNPDMTPLLKSIPAQYWEYPRRDKSRPPQPGWHPQRAREVP